MNEITIYTRQGLPAGRFVVPPWAHPPEVYFWGERVFLRRADGRYTEADGLYMLTIEVPINVVDEVGQMDDPS